MRFSGLMEKPENQQKLFGKAKNETKKRFSEVTRKKSF